MGLIVVVAATVRVEYEEHQAAAERQRDKAAEGHGDEPVDADVVLAEAPPEIDPRHQGGDEQCGRSEEHTSELQSLMRISYAVFCLKKKKKQSSKYCEYTPTQT